MTDFPTLSDLADPADPAEAADAADAAPAVGSISAPAPERVKQILEWLESEGFHARLDEDGDVHIRHEGRDVFILFDDDDPAYIRFLAPGVFACDDSAEQRFLVLNAANRLNASLKAAKICLRSDGAAYISVELFLNGIEAFRFVAPRCLDLLGGATWEFREQMRAEQRRPASGSPAEPAEPAEGPEETPSPTPAAQGAFGGGGGGSEEVSSSTIGNLPNAFAP